MGLFNNIAFNLNISFILAWNVCYATIIIAEFLNLHMKNQNCIYSINLIFQIFLTLFSIIAMSYYSDVYFCFIIVIFQIGNTLNKHLFTFNVKDSIYIDKNNFHLVLTLFTLICLLGSIIKKQKEMQILNEENRDEKEVREVKNFYESQEI